MIALDDRTLWIRVKVSFRKLKEWLKDREARAHSFIPAKLPPIELPGIWFAGPKPPIRAYQLELPTIELCDVSA